MGAREFHLSLRRAAAIRFHWLMIPCMFVACANPGSPNVRSSGIDAAVATPKATTPGPAKIVDTDTVIGVGFGTTLDEARDAALRNAILQFPTLMRDFSEVRGDGSGHQSVLQYSDAVIETAVQVGEPEMRDGMIRCVYRCKVRRGLPQSALFESRLEGGAIDPPAGFAGQRDAGEQRRQGAAMVSELFRGYPWKLLDASQMDDRPSMVGRSKDGKDCIVEVRVRVSVSESRWSAWLTELGRILGPQSLASGEESWGLRQPGWIPLDGRFTNDSLTGAFAGASRANEFRSLPLLQHFLPEGERAHGVLYFTDRPSNWLGRPLPEPACFRKDRVLAVVDAPGSRLHWWQLSPEAWTALCDAMHAPPRIRVALRDSLGKPLGESVQDWWTDDTGRWPLRTQSVGRPELRARIVQEPERRRSITVTWQLGPRTGGESRNRLVVPAADIQLTSELGEAVALSPVSVFPFRFRIACDDFESLLHAPGIGLQWLDP